MEPVFPAVGWTTLQAGRRQRPEVTISTMLSLFLDSRQADGRPNANFKAIIGDNKAIRLYQAGYVSKVCSVREGSLVFSPQAMSARNEIIS